MADRKNGKETYLLQEGMNERQLTVKRIRVNLCDQCMAREYFKNYTRKDVQNTNICARRHGGKRDKDLLI